MFHETGDAFLVSVVASVQESLAAVRLYQDVTGVGLCLCPDTIGDGQFYLMVQSLPRWIWVHARWYLSPELVSSCVTALTL